MSDSSKIESGSGHQTLDAIKAAGGLNGLKRRTGGLNIFGLYVEATMPDGAKHRALLAGDILSTTSLAPSAKGSRWTTVSHGTSGAARDELAKFMSGTDEVSALAVELTQQDINRLQRGVLSTVAYTATDYCRVAADHATSN